MAKLLSCVLGPRLYKIYRERDSERAPSSVPETPTSVTTPPFQLLGESSSPLVKNMVRPKPLCGLCSPAAPIIGNRGSLLVKPVVCKVLFVFPGLKSLLRTGFLLYRRLPPLSHSDYHSLLFPFAAPHPVFRGSCWVPIDSKSWKRPCADSRAG